MRVSAYFDGFNFYYGAVRNTNYKWLNIKALIDAHVGVSDVVTKVKYFTARVKSQPDDLQQPARQQAYFRALKTVPEIDIILGYYLEKQKTSRLRLQKKPILNYLGSKLHPSLIYHNKKLVLAKTLVQEEKGSDVNLASHLIHDAHINSFDHAIVITGDSDLVEAIRIVTQEIKMRVSVVNPQLRPSAELKKVASHYQNLNRTMLAGCLFPDTMKDGIGTFHKPFSW